MFLLALNVFLLLVGCLMEIFPAIVVVVPLIVPLGAAYGIHPVHLGIIFIANLELGYLTPLVGLNILIALPVQASRARSLLRRTANGGDSRDWGAHHHRTCPGSRRDCYACSDGNRIEHSRSCDS